MTFSSPFFTTAAVLALATGISAHGKVTSPLARVPGPAMVEACGQDAVDIVLKDDTVPLEKLSNAPEACQVNLCRGALFEDNKDKVQTFAPGQVVPFAVEIPIPHEGPAHVAIMDTATNKMIGSPLIEFDTYADERLTELPANNTNFEVTIPTTLAKTQCVQPGECVLQWFWFGTNAKQTYESCVDFVMGSAKAPAAAPEGEPSTPAANDEGAPAATPKLPAGAIEEPAQDTEKPKLPVGAIKEPVKDVNGKPKVPGSAVEVPAGVKPPAPVVTPGVPVGAIEEPDEDDDEKPKPVFAPGVPDNDDKLPVASPLPLPESNLPGVLAPAVPEPLAPQPVPGAPGNKIGAPTGSIGVPTRTPAGDIRIVPVPVSQIVGPDAGAVPISLASPESNRSDGANERVFLKTTPSTRKRAAPFQA